MYVCNAYNVCMHACNACMHVIYACVYGCLHACMHVCLYVMWRDVIYVRVRACMRVFTYDVYACNVVWGDVVQCSAGSCHEM